MPLEVSVPFEKIVEKYKQNLSEASHQIIFLQAQIDEMAKMIEEYQKAAEAEVHEKASRRPARARAEMVGPPLPGTLPEATTEPLGAGEEAPV